MREIQLGLRHLRGRLLSATVGLSLATLGACDSLLQVDLPSELTDEALESPAGANDQVNSFIAHFECGYSSFAYFIAGPEDVVDPTAAVYYSGGAHTFGHYPPSGECDLTAQHASFYSQFAVTRAMASTLYDKLNGDEGWADAQIPNRERLSAIASLYAASSLEFFGDVFCEMAVDAGPLLTPDQTLDLAGGWVDRALGHIQAAGDFELPHGITAPSDGVGAEALAHALRARILWAKGDLPGAAAAAANVPEGFVAYVTRGGGLQRRNKVYQQGVTTAFAKIAGVNDWWSGEPNPATGQPWPEIIPFTGYLDLGVLPDGRAVRDDGLPIRTAGPYRTDAESAAVPDVRVQTSTHLSIQGAGGPGQVPAKYRSESDAIPFVNWEEIWLIRAEAAMAAGEGQTAIDLVNDIRTSHGLPLVTYADPGNAPQLRSMILEEKRRSLWLEGRYIATKIQNTDVLWFPRREGRTPTQGVEYGGAVRMLMPEVEYQLNPNLTLADRATGCAPAERPVRFQ